jgi:hypothetical protein
LSRVAAGFPRIADGRRAVGGIGRVPGEQVAAVEERGDRVVHRSRRLAEAD